MDLKWNGLVPISEAMRKRHPLYNGSKEPCDMLYGPCCCGAWHRESENPSEFEVRLFTDFLNRRGAEGAKRGD